MLGSLPTRVRELYGLKYGPRERAEFRAGVALIRSGRRLTPGPLARGYNKRSFDLVARTERRRVERGQPTPQILENGPAGPGIEVVKRAA
jgi:hypothetical protein